MRSSTCASWLTKSLLFLPGNVYRQLLLPKAADSILGRFCCIFAGAYQYGLFMVLQIHKNVSLKEYNTFGLEVKAAEYAELTSVDQLKELSYWIQRKHVPFMILGGGSNILFTKDFPGLVLRINIKGVETEGETDDFVYVKAMAGENWEEFVEYCVAQDWGGIENLTLIPGNVGTSPMQNIGAYGVELKDAFHSLEAWEIETGRVRRFSNARCRFGYRESIFKKGAENRYIILSVCFRLSKRNHQIHIGYGAVKEQLSAMGVKTAGIHDVMMAIQHIRKARLPDPKLLGNAGSFFKNPVISREDYQELIRRIPEVPFWEAGAEKIKVPAAFLIEKCGWKGYREGDAGVHHQQPLVLVNFGKASGKQILTLAGKIQTSVVEKFGVKLIPEVNIV